MNIRTVTSMPTIAKWVLLVLVVLIPVVLTIHDYGITWDEPIYLAASRHVDTWLKSGPDFWFDAAQITRYWQTDPDRNVHPSGVKWLYILAGKSVFWESDPFVQNRIFFAGIFSITLAAFALWITRGNLYRSLAIIILLLLMPRIFAHTHFAATDIPLMAFLLLLLMVIEKTLLTRYFWLAGPVLGILASVKLTGSILAGVGLLFFLGWHHRRWRTVLPRLVLIGVIGLAVFYLLNPDYWFHPLTRLGSFLHQSLHRSEWTPIPVFFAGKLYPFRGPFYYPFVMFGITTPLLQLITMGSGLWVWFHRREIRTDIRMGVAMLFLAFPFLLLSLPTSPAIDGIRYLLPAFPLAAVFMALGAESWAIKSRQLLRHSSFKFRSVGLVLATALLGLGVLTIRDLVHYHPYGLSYYNRLVGGLAGAHRLGFETTYWWDALNDSNLMEINQLCTGQRVYFPLSPTDHFFHQFLAERKIMFLPASNPATANFILIYGRPSVDFWQQRIWPELAKNGIVSQPIWSKSLNNIPLMTLYRLRHEP